MPDEKSGKLTRKVLTLMEATGGSIGLGAILAAYDDFIAEHNAQIRELEKRIAQLEAKQDEKS